MDGNNCFVKTSQFSKVIMHIMHNAWKPKKKDIIYIESLPHYKGEKGEKEKW